MAIEYNPFDPDQVDHHLDLLAELRRTAPVAEVMPGVFYVSRYDDVVAVCRDHDTFRQGGFRPLDEDTRSPDQIQLGESDPPVHTRVRKILAGALSPARVRSLEPHVRQVCEELVDGFAGRGAADLIGGFAAPLPAAVIGHLAGIPLERRADLSAYSDDVIAMQADPDPDRASAAARRVDQFDDELRVVIADRQRSDNRPDDLMTALIEHVDDEGRHLSDEKILTHLARDVVVGGIETTTHLVGNLFFDLLSTPGLYERVRLDRSLVPAVVEETLRHDQPVQVLFRRAGTNAEIHGTPIPRGAIVALGYASANRGDAAFDHPDAFDVDRGDAARRHLGFGWGIHLCVGAALARLEATQALVAVLDRVPAMSLAPGFRYQRVTFFMMRGPVRLDVTLSRR